MKRILILLSTCVLTLTGVNCKDTIEIVGKLYIVGNEPFTKVAIEAEDGKTYVIMGAITDSLRKMQGKVVRVKGKLMGKTVYTNQSIHVIEIIKCK